MKNNYYRDVIEILGMKKPRNLIHNKLNHIYSHSDDGELRKLVKRVVEQLSYSAPNTSVTDLRHVKGISTEVLENYCLSKGYL